MTTNAIHSFEHYRIKKFIRRINPVDYVSYSTGHYVWVMEGRLYTYEHLSLIAEKAVGAEAKALSDRGITCLHQIRTYMDWFKNSGFDDFMMTTHVPILTFMPDWLYWHEVKRLRLSSMVANNQDLRDYYDEALTELMNAKHSFTRLAEGWLVHRGEECDYIITEDGKAARLMGGNIIV